MNLAALKMYSKMLLLIAIIVLSFQHCIQSIVISSI